MSRLSQARQAVRPALNGRMMLSGPSGAGKSWSGLVISTELAQGAPILGIDTEKESMLTYADDFNYVHLPWEPPYDPRELAKTLDEAGSRFGVILIDSLTHFWRGEGGVLDTANGKFTGWKEARPMQEQMVEAILRCQCHVVMTARSKVEHTQEVENGKHVVRKLGMAAQQDDTLEYEMNVAIELTMDHSANISKSRTTALPVGRVFRADKTQEMAQVYREWLASGEPPATREQVEKITGLLDGIGDDHARFDAKVNFANEFGKPDQLAASKFDDALARAEVLAAVGTPPEVLTIDEADAPDEAEQGTF